MTQMHIKDLDFQELLSNQELEIVVGGLQQLLTNEIIKEPFVTESVSLSTNYTTSAEKISLLDSCNCTMGHGPVVPPPPPGPGPIGTEGITNLI